MSTALDIDSIIFTDKDERPTCNYKDCRCVATHVIFFRIMWKCTHPRLYYCLAHKDRVLSLVPSKNGFFKHSDCPGSMLRFDHMEPVR